MLEKVFFPPSFHSNFFSPTRGYLDFLFFLSLIPIFECFGQKEKNAETLFFSRFHTRGLIFFFTYLSGFLLVNVRIRNRDGKIEDRKRGDKILEIFKGAENGRESNILKDLFA